MTRCEKPARSIQTCGAIGKYKSAPAACHQSPMKHRCAATAQPNRPAARAAALPRLRRGARAARSGRDGARDAVPVIDRLSFAERGFWSEDSLTWASRRAARQAEGKTSRGAGGRLRNAGQRAGALHALRGGQRSRPRAGAARTMQQHNAGFWDSPRHQRNPTTVATIRPNSSPPNTSRS